MTMHKTLHPGNSIDRLYGHEKKDEMDMPALSISLMHNHKDSRAVYKNQRK